MEYKKTTIEGVYIIEPKVFNDARGYFFEAWKKEEFEQHIGKVEFVQDNESKSSYGVLRGLHYQKGDCSQAKLVRVIKGKVLDVAVDIRKSSPTFGNYVMVELSDENKRQFFIPRGFAHGFLVLSDEAIFTYKKYLSNQLIINYTFMNIAIVGTGYVGLVSGTCFADTGANVTCVDVDAQKIERLKNGEIPIFEPGLDELVVKNVKAGRLHFTTDLSSVLDDVQIVFSAVGTPPDEDGSADLKYVLQVARTIGQHMNHYLVVVTKSTVPVGTASKVRKAIEEELAKRGLQDLEFDVASNPEFLKEGNAIKDFMSPDRVVVGVESEHAKKVLTKLYKPFLINNFRVIFMDIPSAEMTKYAANSMLATRISFMNDIANLCERVGADVNMVRAGIGADTRIGRKFLYAGCGYGGSCFPKDVKALIKTADQNGYSMEVLKAVERVNERQKSILFEKLQKAFKGEDLKGKTIAMWGLSFKPETDDMRESTALVMIRLLLEAGCTVRAYDPVAMNECKRRIGDTVTYCNDMYDATLDADALLLLTEWKEFRLPTWAVIKKAMKRPLVIDGRNIFDSEDLEENGFEYHCIGK